MIRNERWTTLLATLWIVFMEILVGVVEEFRVQFPRFTFFLLSYSAYKTGFASLMAPGNLMLIFLAGFVEVMFRVRDHLPEGIKPREFALIVTCISAIIPLQLLGPVILGLGSLGSGYVLKSWVQDIRVSLNSLRGFRDAKHRELQEVWKTLKPHSINLPAPMLIMATAAAEHRPRIVFHQEQGSSSADADANHHPGERKSESEQGHHEARNLTWNEILTKFQQLKAEFYALKTGETSYGSDQN